MPYSGFSQQASPDFGKAVVALSSEDTAGFTLSPPLGLLTFEDENGDPIEVEEGEEIPGADAGTFVLLVDGSSSMLQTDPARHRVDAAVMVAERVAQCSTHFDQALLEFTSYASSGKYLWSRLHADFGGCQGEIAEVVEQLSANGGTPLWDATAEVIGGLSEHADGHGPSWISSPRTGPRRTRRVRIRAGDGPSNGPGPGTWWRRARPARGLQLRPHPGRDLGWCRLGEPPEPRRGHRPGERRWHPRPRHRPGARVGCGDGLHAGDERHRGPAPARPRDGWHLRLRWPGGGAAHPDRRHRQGGVCGYTEEVRFASPKARGERVHGKVSLLDTDLGLPFSFTAP